MIRDTECRGEGYMIQGLCDEGFRIQSAGVKDIGYKVYVMNDSGYRVQG